MKNKELYKISDNGGYHLNIDVLLESNSFKEQQELAKQYNGSVAQLVERSPDKRKAAGS